VLRVNTNAGHHGSSQPARARREQAEEIAFVLDRLGLS
jgi:protease II